MFITIYRHELTRHLRGMPFYLFSALFFVSAFAFLSSSNMDMQFLGMSLGAKSHNAPTVLAQLMARLSVFGSLFAVVIVGQAVVRDFENKVHDAFFTLPLSKWQYLGGRFFGSVSALVLTYSGLVLGAILGCLVHSSAQYGPFEAVSFLLPLALIVLPNMLFTGSLFFAVATLTRRIMPAYLCAIGLILLYIIVTISLALLAPDSIRVLADPFAIVAIDTLTQFWTVNDINQRQLPVLGPLLANRMIWLSVTVLVGIFTYRRFGFVSQLEADTKTRSKLTLTEDFNEGKTVQYLTALNGVATSHSFATRLQQLVHLVKRESGFILRHPIFIILTALSLFDILTNFIGQTSADGDNQLPLTINYLKHIGMAWGYMLPMTIIFAASLVWKQRDAGIHPLFDALPVPRWVKAAGVLLTLMAVQTAVVTAMLLAGVLCQWLVFGHTQFELAQYFKTLFGLQLPAYWFIGVMVVFIQVLSPSKNSGIALLLPIRCCLIYTTGHSLYLIMALCLIMCTACLVVLVHIVTCLAGILSIGCWRRYYWSCSVSFYGEMVKNFHCDSG